MIVGTHLDKITFSRSQDLKVKYKEKIKNLYGKAGFPTLSAYVKECGLFHCYHGDVYLYRIIFVAATTQEGIKELQERIHHAAITAIDHDTRDPIIGMQVHTMYIISYITTTHLTTLSLGPC